MNMTRLELLREVEARITLAATTPPSPFDNELLNEIKKAIIEEKIKEFSTL